MSKLGVALGGGGARGFAHIGLLKVLDSENINIHTITGCRMGAIIGGLYAYLGNAEKVEKFVYESLHKAELIENGTERLNNHYNNSDRNYFKQFYDYIDVRLQVLKSFNHLSYFDDEKTRSFFDMLPDVRIENLSIKFSALPLIFLPVKRSILLKGICGIY